MKHVEQLIKYRPSPHWTRLATASVFAIALAGCGGGGGGDATVVTPTPSVPTVSVPTGTKILLRPSEVLSGIANPPVLKVAKNALRSLLQHSHMRGGRFA